MDRDQMRGSGLHPYGGDITSLEIKAPPPKKSLKRTSNPKRTKHMLQNFNKMCV
jgi:hypothetical protein